LDFELRTLVIFRIMPQIIPTLLCSTFEEFSTQVKQVEPLFSYAQIDVMDGKFVPSVSFSDVNQIAALSTSLKYELHLMVADPIAEIQKWKSIPNIFRAIFHMESSCDPTSAITAICELGWEVGIALNPDTPLTLAGAFYDLVDVVLFMTVNPGKQGQKFIPEVGEKIAQFTGLTSRPKCAVDGGINKYNIAQVTNYGAELLYVGSALMKSGGTMEEAYRELQEKMTKAALRIS